MTATVRRLLLLAIVCSSPAFAADKRAYRCYRLAAPPAMDGQLNDDAWKALPASNSFRNLADGAYTAKQTYIKLGWNDQDLFIGVRCDEPEMKLLSANMRDGDALWLEDGIEIFIQPDPGAGYFQFAVNSLGAKIGVERAGGLALFEAKGFHGPDFFTVEIRLPFAIFGKTPKAGEMWRGNIDRNIWAGGKIFSCWAPLQGSFHDTANFGRFIFEAQQASAELAASAEKSDADDGAHRSALIARINEVVKKCDEYAPDLARGLEMPAYRKEAQDLRDEAEGYKALRASASAAAIRELTAGTRSCEDFFRKIFDFKYRVLIARLLQEE